MKCRGLVMLIFSIVICLSWSCKTAKTVASPDSLQKKAYLFPMEWLGHYEGELTLQGLGNDTTIINMQLTIGSPDASGLYPWILQYGDTDKRYYGIEVVNAEKGHYLIDEYNSIKLDAYLRGNNFISRFAVSSSDLIFHYEKTHQGIYVRVYASSSGAVSETGGEIIGKDTIPQVAAFPILGYQKALLRKVKN